MLSSEVIALVDAADINGLLRVVDGLCSGSEWDQLLDLAERCEDAIERGKQLWPIAAHIDYRLALEAPGELAASVLDPNFGRFAVGPLTEVAAYGHSWGELAPHLDDARVAAYVAQERVLRGEVLTDQSTAHPEVLELPASLQPWEPTYTLATYGRNYVEVAEPWEPKHPLARSPCRRLSPWRIRNWKAPSWTSWDRGPPSPMVPRAVVVEGDAGAAASALTYGTLRMAVLDPAEALQRFAWAAASGGAHGRRRGAAWEIDGLVLRGTPGRRTVAPPDLRVRHSETEVVPVGRGGRGEGLGPADCGRDPDDGWSAAIAATDLVEDALD